MLLTADLSGGFCAAAGLFNVTGIAKITRKSDACRKRIFRKLEEPTSARKVRNGDRLHKSYYVSDVLTPLFVSHTMQVG